jgi:hypothetical protein
MATNNLRLGSETPSNFYVGSEAVNRIYFGSELVFDPVIIFGAPDFTSTTTGSITAGTLVQAAHGLASTPDLVLVEFVCLVNNNGYVVGDVIPWHGLTYDNNIGSIGEGGEIIGRNATNVFVQLGANYTRLPLKDGSSAAGSYAGSNWGIRFKVWENVERTVSSDLGAVTPNTAYTFAHGLGAGTYYVTTEYTCVIAEDGYSVGDIIENQSYLINSGNGTDVSRSHSVGYNDTDAWDLIASSNYLNKVTGQNAGAPTDANWEMRIVVYDLGTPDFVSGDISWTLASNTSVNHSLATVDYMMGEFVCTAPDDNWAVGDKMPINHQAWDRASDDNNSRGSTVGYYSATALGGVVLDAGAYTYGTGTTAAFSVSTYDPVNDKYLIVSRNDNLATMHHYHADWDGATLTIGTEVDYARTNLSFSCGVKWHDLQGYAIVSIGTTLGFYAVDTSGVNPVAPAGSVPSLVSSRACVDFDIKQSTGEIAFVYINSSNVTQIQARTCSVDASGNMTMAPTGGTDRVLVTTAASQTTQGYSIGFCYVPTQDKWYLVYDNAGSINSAISADLRIVEISLSGSTFTVGTPVALPMTNFAGNLQNGGIDLAYDSVNDRLVVAAGVKELASSTSKRDMYGWIVDFDTGGEPLPSNDLLILDGGITAHSTGQFRYPHLEFCSLTGNFHFAFTNLYTGDGLSSGDHVVSFSLNSGLTDFQNVVTNTPYTGTSQGNTPLRITTNAEDNGDFLLTTVTNTAIGNTGQTKVLEDSTADGEFYLSMPPTYNMIHLDKLSPSESLGAVMNPANWAIRFSGWGTSL